MNFSGKMRESGTSTPISGGKTDEWVNSKYGWVIHHSQNTYGWTL
jgi:hypothetical protein